MSVERRERAVLANLDGQHRRRAQGIPTLSVLVGPAGAARHLWLRWIRSKGGTSAAWSPASTGSLVTIWLEALLGSRNLRQHALAYLAEATREPPEQVRSHLRGKTEYEKELYWQRLPIPAIPAGALVVLRWLFDQIVQEREPCVDDAPVLAGLLGYEASCHPEQVFFDIAQIVRPSVLPGLLVTIPPLQGGNTRQTTAQPLIGSVAAIAERLPALPLALSVDSMLLERYLRGAPESRTKAIFREGVIGAAPLSAEDIRAWLADRGVKDEHVLEGLAEPLARCGATSALLEDALSLVRTLARVESDEQSRNARSHAERFLFNLLEASPDTSGLFALNARLSVPFGNRSMEVDLFAESMDVAVEIDGYYHFQDPASYRRDRRKDLTLQQQGYLVLRFLAEDVVSRLEEVLTGIWEALTHQRNKKDRQET